MLNYYYFIIIFYYYYYYYNIYICIYVYVCNCELIHIYTYSNTTVTSKPVSNLHRHGAGPRSKGERHWPLGPAIRDHRRGARQKSVDNGHLFIFILQPWGDNYMPPTVQHAPSGRIFPANQVVAWPRTPLRTLCWRIPIRKMTGCSAEFVSPAVRRWRSVAAAWKRCEVGKWIEPRGLLANICGLCQLLYDVLWCFMILRVMKCSGELLFWCLGTWVVELSLSVD